MKRTIVLENQVRCRECGTDLFPGDKARHYGPGRVYGTTCHARTDPKFRPRRRSRNDKLAARRKESSNAED